MSPEHLAAWTAFKEAVDGLESVLRNAASEEPERRQVSLLTALNHLELAVLALPDLAPETSDAGGSPDTHADRRRELQTAFPELGYYNTADMRSVDPEQKAMIGDAADDLADILRDLDDVLWREANEGVVAAIWQGRESYETHFGAHLADLRAYLYRLRFFGH
jgi:hypothetical protein